MTSGPVTPTRTLYALLVGIDAYRDPVPPLRGCVADIERIGDLLRLRAAAAGDDVVLLTLTDEEATRAAVVDAFREHLGRAGPDDTALFYYSGHGSQQPTLPEHLELEPDGLDETLVLADSRDPGGHDLADKELAVLVGEIADAAGHLLVVLDCCHSGSGLRALDEDGVRVRRAPTDLRVRSADTYLAGSVASGASGTRALGATGAPGTPDALGATGATGALDAPGTSGDIQPSEADWLGLEPRGGYVLLAACRSDQTAKEIRVDGVDRGAFSVALQRALAGTGGQPTYLDLQRWAAAAVRNLAADQSPVLEAPRAGDVARPFLGGVAAPREPVLAASFVARRGWVLDAGRLHGLDDPGEGVATTVDLHPLAGGDRVTTATVRDLRVTTATLEPADEGALDRGATYRAVVTSAGQPRTTVAVTGDTPEAEQIRAGLAASPLVRLAEATADSADAAPDDASAVEAAPDDAAPDVATADLVVTCTAETVRVTRPGSARALAAEEPSGASGVVATTVRTCEHIGRWLGIAHRANPTTRLRPEDVTLTVHDQAGDPIVTPAGGVEVTYGPDGENPVVRIGFANRSDEPLHCAVLALTELYGVECLTTGGSVLLQPGESGWVTDESDRPQVRTFVPEGQDRTTDLLKLLVSTEPFDAQPMAQEELRPPTLTRGATRTGERGFSRATMPAAGRDWTTRDVVVTTVRPGDWTSVGRQDRRELAPGVAILGHPTLAARARLGSRHTATRGALVPLLPPAFLEPDAATEPFALGGTRAVGEDLSVLELDDVAGAESVTAEDPLVLRVARPLGPDEHVVAIGFDGEDYLPLGRALARGAETDIVLERLPVQTPQARRSLGGSLKILFRKLVLRRVGVGYHHPLLSAVDYRDGTPAYVHDADAVARAVRGAERLLLVVHGILGDTRGALAAAGAGPDPLRMRYDAVLALDYENINTTVPETARALATRLAAAGLRPGQQVDVVAHSMGGLVARWWVDREGGSAVVRRLVTCGTPFAGSPWPRVQDVATTLLTLAANGLGPLLGGTLAFLLRGFEGVDDALDAMTPGSWLLEDLAGRPPSSGVTYVTVAGNEPFGPVADAGRARRILTKLRLPGAVLDLVFGGRAHDVAVAVDSATAVGRSWPEPPTTLDVGCNHMGYFSSAPGLAVLRQALGS